MKRSILTLLALGVAVSAFGQGIVNYTTRVSLVYDARVYGPEAGNPTLTGNTAGQLPAGSQTYAGPLLAGSGFSAQLFAANLVDQPEGSLTPVVGSLTSFRTGSVAGTIFPNGTLAVAQVPLGGNGTFQLRAWDNAGGTITSYDNATTRGKSAVFNLTGLGDGGLNVPRDMDGIRSFNLQIVPEPGTFVLAGMGAAALLIFRRRK